MLGKLGAGVDLKAGLLQALLTALVAVVAVAGAVVTIVAPHTLTFHSYLTDLKDIAYSVAGLGVGKGLHLGLSNLGSRQFKALEPAVGELIQGKVGQAVADAEKDLPAALLPTDQQEAATKGQAPDPSAVEALSDAVERPLPTEGLPHANDGAPAAAEQPAAETPAVEPEPVESPLTPEELATYDALSKRIAATTTRA